MIEEVLNREEWLIFESKAHQLCRQWKKDTGLTNAQIAECLNNMPHKGCHQSNVSRWMGDSKVCAQLLPEKHAYTLYWEYYLAEKFSEQQAWSKEIDAYLNQTGAPPRNMGDYYEGKGKFTRFPYYEYLRYRRAINAVLSDKDRVEYGSLKQLLRELHTYESGPEIEIKEKFQELREILELVLSENQSGHDPLPVIRLTNHRKQTLQMLFHYWLRLDDRTDMDWEFVPPLWGNPENAKAALMELLEEDK